MINLIPPQGHTALKHEYLLRIGSMYGFVLGGVLIASAALMVPTYVLTSSQLKAMQTQNAETTETQEAFDRASNEIKIANAIMSQLRVGEAKVEYSTIIEEIVRNTPPGITFNTFQGKYLDGEPSEIGVQGFAPNRNSLASFKDELEDSPMFDKAIIPIADLARDINLPFVVTVILAKQQIEP